MKIFIYVFVIKRLISGIYTPKKYKKDMILKKQIIIQIFYEIKNYLNQYKIFWTKKYRLLEKNNIYRYIQQIK